jgi:hypothetical protein
MGLLARVLALGAPFVLGCSDLPSKGDALEVVQREVQEEGSCVLPIPIFTRFKMQYTTKAVCVPREEGVAVPGAKDAALTCLDGLAAAGTTKRMPASYMAEWPDEVSGAGFDSISPYERRARDLVFKSCFEMADLREGRFRCGQAKADKVLRITKKEERQALVRYSRAIAIDPTLPAIEAACGPVTRPPAEATVTLEKVDKQWAVAPEGGSAPSGSASGSASAKPR